jgi:aminoglycoside 2'-N-acetyltransferase I
MWRMSNVLIAHTADLDQAVLKAARALLDDAFDGEFDDHDWDHALGGMHALAWDGDELVGHASVVQRRLLHGGRALRAGYVEGVGVRADRRRDGHGAALMEAIGRVVRRAYEIGALAATDGALDFYAACGWQAWQGPTSALGPDGIVRTEDDDGSVHVLPVTAELDLGGEITCYWRGGAVW